MLKFDLDMIWRFKACLENLAILDWIFYWIYGLDDLFG